MFSNRAAFALLAALCVTATGGGAYLAMRQNADPVVPAPPVAEVPAAAADQVEKPVHETEAIIGEPTRPQPAVTPAAPPAAAATGRKREAAPARPSTKTARATGSSSVPSSQLPTLDRSWPSSTPPAPSATQSQNTPVEPPAPLAAVEVQEPPRAPEPPAPTFEEVVVSADSVIGLQVETALSSETARVEDRVEAHVVRDVRSGGTVAIPAGSRALGTVMVVERGGKFKERARLGIRFNTLVLADGTRLPLSTETIYRLGDAQGQGSAAKIGGGAVVGAILGAIAGGAKGAAIGAATGGGAGTAAVAIGDRSVATFTPGTEVTARILAPVTVTIEK